MKILIFLSFFLICEQAQSQDECLFKGSIIYQISSGSKTYTVSYFFSPNFVKRIDTSDNLISRAGFTEFIWDLQQRRQYFINHGLKLIYFLEFKPQQAISLLGKKTGNNEGAHFASITRCDITLITLKDRRDTLIDTYKLYLSDSLRVKPLLSDRKFENLSLFTGFIPLKVEIEGSIRGNNSYKSIIKAKSIEENNLPDHYFSLPQNYVLKPYNEDEMKEYVGDAAKRKIDFLKEAKDLLWRKGVTIDQ